MRKKIHRIGNKNCILFTDEEAYKFNLEVGSVLNMDDCFVELEADTEEASYWQDKRRIKILEGEFAPRRLKQAKGTIIIQ